MSAMAERDSVFIAPESKVTQAMPLRISCLKLLMIGIPSSAGEIDVERGEPG